MEEKKKRKPFVPTQKWLDAQARLKQERITNPEKFKPRFYSNRYTKKPKVPENLLSRSEYNQVKLGVIQRLSEKAFKTLEEQIDNASSTGNPVATSLVLKNLNDISNSIQEGGGLSKAKETKELMQIDGKQLNREALIRLNESADIENLSDLQRLIDNNKQNS